MTAPTDSSSHNETTPKSRLQKILSLLLPLLIIGLAIGLAFWLAKSGPKAGKRTKVRNAVLVETQPVKLTTERVVLTAHGTVKAAREVELKAQVIGEIIALSSDLIPGGQVRKGDTLLTIDPRDYQLALRQQENNVARAAAELQLERGNQLLAQKEYELLGSAVSDEEKSLMLRQPQLQALQAALDSAKAARDQARLNLARTRITAPFNGIVASRQVNAGSQVTTATALAILVASDRYWVEATIPVVQLRWIAIPRNDTETGSLVHIGGGTERQGRVLRLLPGLEEQGRMARLLIEINDPLSLTAKRSALPSLPPLLLGSWVQLAINGHQLPKVVALDRAWLRDGDQVWLRDDAGKLKIRPVQVAFRGRDHVLIETGLVVGEKIITSALSAPVAGMTLRTRDEAKPSVETTENKKNMQEPER